MLFPDFQKNIFDIIKVLNPFQVLISAVEENKENFRIDVDMRYLNELIHLEVLEESENLLDLDVIAREGKLITKGEYHVGDYTLAKFFKVHEVLFHVELSPVWVKSNHVRFRVTNYKIWNKERKKFDLVKIVSRIFPYHKNYLLKDSIYSVMNFPVVELVSQKHSYNIYSWSYEKIIFVKHLPKTTMMQ